MRAGGGVFGRIGAAEVVDGAAILFDPYAVDEMVRAIADILVDGELRARMERLGCSARRISAGRRRLPGLWKYSTK